MSQISTKIPQSCTSCFHSAACQTKWEMGNVVSGVGSGSTGVAWWLKLSKDISLTKHMGTGDITEDLMKSRR